MSNRQENSIIIRIFCLCQTQSLPSPCVAKSYQFRLAWSIGFHLVVFSYCIILFYSRPYFSGSCHCPSYTILPGLHSKYCFSSTILLPSSKWSSLVTLPALNLWSIDIFFFVFNDISRYLMYRVLMRCSSEGINFRSIVFFKSPFFKFQLPKVFQIIFSWKILRWKESKQVLIFLPFIS